MVSKAKIFAAILSAGAMLAAVGPAQALYDPTIPGLTYTGLSYSAPFGGPHRSQVEGDIEDLISGDALYVGRLDTNLDQTVAGSGSTYFANSLDGMCLDSGCTTGSWSFNPGPINYLIAFVEISTAGTARLYELTDYALLGSWNTNALSTEPDPIHRLSHMDFYAVLGDGANVPEPGVLLLLAVGLVGVSAIRRRRRDTPSVTA